jgi:hypothetical protein
MKPKFWQTPAFKELEREWHDRLREAQFKDAEKLVNGRLVLRRSANGLSDAYRDAPSSIERANKLRYYEILGIGFNSTEFDDEVESLVLERRSEGTKIKHICEELRQLGERCHRQTVRHIIRKYELKWGIKRKR